LYLPLCLFLYAALLFVIFRHKDLLTDKILLWALVWLLVQLLPSILFFNAFRYRLAAVPLLIFFALLFYSTFYKNTKWMLVNLGLIVLLGSQLTSGLLIQKIPRFETYSFFGQGYVLKGKTERAGYWFEKARKNMLQSEYYNEFDNYKGNAIAMEKEGNLEGALVQINYAIRVAEDNPEGYLRKGAILYKMGRYAEADTAYVLAIGLSADKTSSQQAWYGCGLSKARLDEDSAAITAFDSCLALDPGYSEAYINRGTVYARMGVFQKALEDFNKALTLNPGSDKIYANRAGIYAATGQENKAITDLGKAIQINPSEASYYFMRGKLFVSAGKTDAGCADMKKAYSLGFVKAKDDMQASCNQ
jgi:tetratricopeptide (TPR) repeat protein